MLVIAWNKSAYHRQERVKSRVRNVVHQGKKHTVALERDLHRKERAPAVTAALLVIPNRADTICAED